MPGPLAGYRVLDLSRILAGPWASQLLADLGADVIKVERPGSGDDTRGWGPPFMLDEAGEPTTEAAYFHAANRGKRSIAIDIAQAEGQRLVRELASASDVLVENFKVGGLARYGLDYASLKAVNPALIYCSITGFGQDGPYAARAGYDFMIQAMGGIMSVTGEIDGEPMKSGVALADILTGLYAANAIQAALLHRERGGEGQYIDMALLDVQVATLASQAMNYLATRANPPRYGNAHPNIVPYQAFRTRDGYIILAVGNDAQFRRFCELAGRPELADDARFLRNRDRVQNRVELLEWIAAVMRERASADWLDGLHARGIPCGPINNIDEVFADPQVRHRGLELELEHPSAGSVASVACPIRLSQTPVEYERAPPLLGAHTDEVLAELLGLDGARITALRGDGIIA